MTATVDGGSRDYRVVVVYEKKTVIMAARYSCERTCAKFRKS